MRVTIVLQPQTNHNGGWIGFGPDGYPNVAAGEILKIIPDPLVGTDCNNNGVDDDCDLLAGADDVNGNGVLDDCECIGDLNGVTDLTGLGTLLTDFGPAPADPGVRG